MVTLLVIVPYEFCDCSVQGLFSKKDHPVQTLLPDCAHEPLGIGVQVWGAGRQAKRFDLGTAKGLSGLFREQGGPVVNQVAAGPENTVPRIGEVSRHLLHPQGIGFRHDARELNFSGRQANDEQYVVTN